MIAVSNPNKPCNTFFTGLLLSHYGQTKAGAKIHADISHEKHYSNLKILPSISNALIFIKNYLHSIITNLS